MHASRSTNLAHKSLVFGALLAAVMVGCGEPVAPVTGKVTYKGEAVTGGTLIFSPVGAQNQTNPGNPTSATIKSDGTYQIEGGGAMMGKNMITYTAPPGKASTDPDKEGEMSPYANLAPQQKEVD